MKTVGIVLLTIYIVVLVLVFIAQILFCVFIDYEQNKIPWKMILKQSLLWPVMLIKIIIGVIG